MILTDSIILFFLILLSAFFSGSETAFMNLKVHRKSIPAHLKAILKDEQLFLTSVLSANTVVNISIAVISTYLTSYIFKQYGFSDSIYLWILEVFVVGMIILVFGEIVPKKIAIRKSMQFARISYYPLKFFLVVITPFAFIVNLIINSIMTFFPFIKKEKVFDTEEELKIATELGEADGTIEEDESEMIQSVLEFDNKMVREIMTPRVDISSISSEASIDDLMDLIKEKKYSKIPMYDESIDKIKGIIYAKDLLPYLIGSRPEKINISDFCKDALFIPENKPIDDMLEEFRSKKTQIAIIVDEWGGTAGLVTVEDIVEEVFGEIRDPYDIENDLFIKRTDNHYSLDAKIGIYDIEEELDIDFPEDRDYDTLGGYIFFSLGKIPEVKESVSFGKWNFEVKSIVDNRIKKVEAKRKL
tara:strand:- start:449 stop:1693 length:1245 start_codon:yes stop_codon:yes gene_type:complete